MTSVGEDFPREQQRCRELLGIYEGLGSQGAFGALVIRDALSKAEQAMASGDVVAIVRSYEELRGLR